MSSSSSSATSTTTPTPAKGTNNRRIIKTAISDDNDEEGTDLIPQTPSKKKRASPKHSPTKADAWTPEMRLKLFEAYQDASQVKWDDVAKKIGGGKTGSQCREQWQRATGKKIRKALLESKD